MVDTPPPYRSSQLLRNAASTGDGANTSEKMVQGARIRNQTVKPAYHVRSPAEIAGYFDGLALVEPGVVSISRWRPEPSPSGPPPETPAYGGIGRKQ